MNFNSRTAWGSSTSGLAAEGGLNHISIPVLRGEVQRIDYTKLRDWAAVFQFPYCVGNFNLMMDGRSPTVTYFNFRTAWGSSTLRNSYYTRRKPRFQFPYCVGKFNITDALRCGMPFVISIPVLRGE